MRFVHAAALMPLAFLVACGGNPHRNGLATGTPGTNATADTAAQQALLQGGTGADPSRLKGLSPLQVRAVLGKPMFTRRDAPAEIWQYRGRACTIDLFLYEDAGKQTVTHVAVRGQQQQQTVNESQCFGELVGRAGREEANPAS